MNHYPLDNSIAFSSNYPKDSDSFGGCHYPAFEQPGPAQQRKLEASGIQKILIHGNLTHSPSGLVAGLKIRIHWSPVDLVVTPEFVSFALKSPKESGQ